MPLNIFNLPDLATLVQNARAAMAAALPGSNPWLWPNNANPSAKVVGGAVWQAYQRLDFVGRQSFALFAEGSYLDAHGAELGLARKQATGAVGNIVVTPGGTGGITFATGGTFIRGDGAIFAATDTVGASSGPIVVPVAGPAGAGSNTEANSPMTIGSGLSGAGAAGSTAAVDGAGLAGGADIEPDGAPRTRDLSTYRGRILFRKANPAQGGSPADWVGWALQYPGVTRVYVERRWAGAGTVRVFPLADNLYANGVPSIGFITLINAFLQPFAPAGCALTVAAPTAFPIDVAIAGLNPNAAAVQAAIAAELADAFRRLGRVSGSDAAFPGMDYLASPLTFPALWIEQAVANASGVISADVAATDQAVPAGQMPVPGVISYT